MVDSEQYRQNGASLGKCTHQQDEEHGNNNTQDEEHGNNNTQDEEHGNNNTQDEEHGNNNTQDEEHGNNNTQALSTICLLPEDWQTTKEEGSKEEDRQEGAGARNVENEYVNLEKCRQNKTTTTKQWHTLNDAEINDQ